MTRILHNFWQPTLNRYTADVGFWVLRTASELLFGEFLLMSRSKLGWSHQLCLVGVRQCENDKARSHSGALSLNLSGGKWSHKIMHIQSRTFNSSQTNTIFNFGSEDTLSEVVGELEQTTLLNYTLKMRHANRAIFKFWVGWSIWLYAWHFSGPG